MLFAILYIGKSDKSMFYDRKKRVGNYYVLDKEE